MSAEKLAAAPRPYTDFPALKTEVENAHGALMNETCWPFGGGAGHTNGAVLVYTIRAMKLAAKCCGEWRYHLPRDLETALNAIPCIAASTEAGQKHEDNILSGSRR